MSATWRDQPERGSQGMKRLAIWLALHAGRPLCRLLLVPTSAYYLVAAPDARKASREFLSRALGRTATWRDSFRHLFVFATTLLDRIFLLHGRHRDLKVTVVNEPVFDAAYDQGRGCLLLGSHLGSFEMLAVVGGIDRRLAVNMVMHQQDSAGLRDLLKDTGFTIPYKVIALGHPESMLRVKECLERGEVVGILADRIYGQEATQSVTFLGSPARLSQSPFRLARILGVPVVSVFGLYRGDRRYDIVFETLATPDPELYAATLERHARAAPWNWFNFHDFWAPGP